jgi:hypothetical protein
MTLLFLPLLACASVAFAQMESVWGREASSLPQAAGAASSYLRLAGLQTPVQRPKDPAYESGLILARPVKEASYKGLIKTWEADLVVGGIPGDPDFIGESFAMSFESSDADPTPLILRFNRLEKDRNYVFKYRRPKGFRIQETHTFITAIQEASSPEEFPGSGLPEKAESTIGRSGTKSSSKRNGFITRVERWGFFKEVCGFELVQGGITAEKTEEGTSNSLNSVSFAVYSEEACSYAENLLRYQVRVQVAYTEDFVEIWDSYTHIAHEISILGKAPDAKYEAFKEKLLNDPDFLRRLQEKINKPGLYPGEK